jgi:hypothetical protein
VLQFESVLGFGMWQYQLLTFSGKVFLWVFREIIMLGISEYSSVDDTRLSFFLCTAVFKANFSPQISVVNPQPGLILEELLFFFFFQYLKIESVEAHVYNPSFLRGRDGEDLSLRTAGEKN